MILNMTGQGGSGGTLTVTTPGAGITVTAAKDGKTKTKVSGSDGTAVFKGLEGGTWTITMTDGSQTAQKTAIVTTDYAVALTFFAATINVAYPTGSICTATDGVTTLTAPDTSGTWACVVPNAGTWTISLDNGFEETVEVTENGATYTAKWYLLKGEDERTNITGGWVSNTSVSIWDQTASGSVTKNANGLVFGTSRIVANTKNKIDLTNYKTLCITITELTYELVCSVMSDMRGSIGNGPYKVAGMWVRSIGTVSIDVSSLSGEHYIALGSDGTCTATVSKIWIEG